MKKLIICLGLFTATLFGTQAWGTMLSFNPLTPSIIIGESADIDIVISGLSSDVDVGAFDFNLLYDEDVLRFDSYNLTDNLGDISALEAEDWSLGYLGNGSVNLSEFSWLSDLSFQKDSFTLATLSFTGIGLGNSQLSFDAGYLIGDYWGDSISSITGDGLVAVAAPVPEPGTVFLFGAGIVGLFAARIRRKKKN